MAAMEAADASGGDSRCSCPPPPADGSTPTIPCDGEDRARRLHPDGREDRHERRLAQQRQVHDVPHGDAARARGPNAIHDGENLNPGEDAAHALRRVAQDAAGVVQMRSTALVALLCSRDVTAADPLWRRRQTAAVTGGTAAAAARPRRPDHDADVGGVDRRRSDSGEVLAAGRRRVAAARVERRARQRRELRAHRARSRRRQRQRMPTTCCTGWCGTFRAPRAVAARRACRRGRSSPTASRQISVTGPYYRGPAAPASGPRASLRVRALRARHDARRARRRRVAGADARRGRRGDGRPRPRQGGVHRPLQAGRVDQFSDPVVSAFRRKVVCRERRVGLRSKGVFRLKAETTVRLMRYREST